MYLHEYDNWWDFRYDKGRVMNELGRIRAKQGLLLGRMMSLGFDFQDEALLSALTMELTSSSEIEGENLDFKQVRSSIARRLGIETAGMVEASRYVEGVVMMLLDATTHYDEPLTDKRLFGWHNVLFPSGMSGLYQIEVARYRSGEMQVVSGPMGREKVHYQAPSPERVPQEMERFIHWINSDSGIDDVIKAAIAHLWFVTIHPFDDGNGRIARALTDMLLARSEHTSKRFYSMSAKIKLQRNIYYDTLEHTQRGDGDITDWILWFLQCFDQALDGTNETLSNVLDKARYWEYFAHLTVNERQRKLINMQFDGFFGKLTSGKWAKIAKCSSDTALNDIKDLLEKGMLVKNGEGGRSTNYSLTEV
ncbi:MAG: Fic family protein [Bacteroidaceae bacterium]|nr:Fic family protein [Bacteroidaceae bacterium]